RERKKAGEHRHRTPAERAALLARPYAELSDKEKELVRYYRKAEKKKQVASAVSQGVAAHVTAAAAPAEPVAVFVSASTSRPASPEDMDLIHEEKKDAAARDDSARHTAVVPRMELNSQDLDDILGYSSRDVLRPRVERPREEERKEPEKEPELSLPPVHPP